MTEWQGVITGEGDRALGTLASVAAKLTAQFPGLSFEWSPTGADQLAAVEGRGVELPELVRRIVAAKPSNFCGSIKAGVVSISFNLGTGEPVKCIWATVAGEPEPVKAALALLQSQEGWVLASPEPLSVEPVAPNRLPHLTGGARLVFETSQGGDI